MKKLILVLSVLLAGCSNDTKPTASELKECPITVRFSPKGGVTESIVAGIQDTATDVKIQAFSFTSLPIAKALIDVKKSGKNIEAILDRENLGNK